MTHHPSVHRALRWGLAALILCCSTATRAITFPQGRPITLSIDTTAAPMLAQVYRMLQADVRQVLDAPLTLTQDEAQIRVYEDTTLPREGFRIQATRHTLSIAGADAHGMAYGMLHLSRMMGVSPWEWWADATPRHLSKLDIKAGTHIQEAPAVPYRGIFINDEDWGLMPWAHHTMGDSLGVIGPQANERVMQLLLRLRANTLWPAMHACTQPFFLTPGNREMAARYGIYIGTSHCEPLACNALGEWPVRGDGEYDYVKNDSAVYHFWDQRISQVGGQEMVYTLGMRGVHDGKMRGAETPAEQRDVLTRVLRDQRDIIARHTGRDINTVPQVFIPYKEVLDVYLSGLQVPQDVTLMWTDDNYGFIRHFPTQEERQRSGGNGIYYHVSYWGRPLDYLWLGTTSPGLLLQQMGEAWDRGIREMWILNVGDIKPTEYQIELFMDLAWNPDRTRQLGPRGHLQQFLAREFGDKAARALIQPMLDYYHLCWIRRPEFLGGTRTEETNQFRWDRIVDMPWDEAYIAQRTSQLQAISRIVATTPIAEDRRDTYYQLVAYPVLANEQMNLKFTSAQLARHAAPTDTAALWRQSDLAYDSIATLTERYNANPRWHGIMDMAPRRLSVFDRVPHMPARNPMPTMDYRVIAPFRDITELGYSRTARSLRQGESIQVPIELQGDTLQMDICLLPTHPVSGDSLRFSVSLDGSTPQTLDHHTVGRSEEWKLNILRGQAVRHIAIPARPGKHTLTIHALDDGIVLDELHQMNP